MIGGKKVKFELLAEDDAADPKQGTAAAQKLCDAKVAGVAGHLNSGTTIPASKVYNDCGIPMSRRGHQPQPDQAWLQNHVPSSSPTTTPWALAWPSTPQTRSS
jgi:ABC-type branched-subunit amino acid transport system substrate-binding protein